MAPYSIFIDASADIDPAVRDRHGIQVVPLPYLLDGEQRQCTGYEDEAFKRAFYEAEKNGALAKTAAASPQIYLDRFVPELEQGRSVLYLALSSGLSGTYDSARIAAEQLNGAYEAQVHVVDTLSASAGEAMIAEEAALNRARGLSLEENRRWIQDHKLLQQHWFMVDDLLYLRRGGRLSAASALLGTALSLKPVLTVTAQGTLEPRDKRRGAKAGMRRLLELMDGSYGASRSKRCYVTHCNNEAGADYLREQIQERHPDAQVSVCNMLPFIGSHVGPGLVSVFHWGDEAHRRV